MKNFKLNIENFNAEKIDRNQQKSIRGGDDTTTTTTPTVSATNTSNARADVDPNRGGGGTHPL